MLEKEKFSAQDAEFHNYIAALMDMDIPPKDFVHQFPLFTGGVNLARYLFFYEMYKKTLGMAGHICEVGIWKGSSFMYFSKLVQIFEPHSQTQVHGFDWFKGMDYKDQRDTSVHNGQYSGEKETLLKLIELQGLTATSVVHDMDVTKDIVPFLEANLSLTFKVIFLDCAVYEVLEVCLKNLWPRLVKGGVLIFDHANNQEVPQEQAAIRDVLGSDLALMSWPHTRTPTAYVQKA